MQRKPFLSDIFILSANTNDSIECIFSLCSYAITLVGNVNHYDNVYYLLFASRSRNDPGVKDD